MVPRILCAVLGHLWDRSLAHGHPSKTCDRCGLKEWAYDPARRVAADRPSQGRS